MSRPRNPYIAGRALGQDLGFFGRGDILDLVTATLLSPDQNSVVLFGQRRIGKTSILLQLQRRLPAPSFLPVYFDLMDRAHRPLGQVLRDLATVIADRAHMAAIQPAQFDDEGRTFREVFLPALYRALPEHSRPVLLLDEFDVIDAAADAQLSPAVAARALFPYLRQLMESEPRLGFVFVIGRRAEDLSINVKATFKAARYKRVSVLDANSARLLVTTAQRQGSLFFADDAVERVLELTSGHPYLTQLLSQALWEEAHAHGREQAPRIEASHVEAIVPKVLEAGENVFEWIWDGLPPAERVIFAAIAASERPTVTEEELLTLLQRHGIRILTHELELAPNTLVEWEMLRATAGGYCFFVEILRRWIALRKPLPKVRDELDRVVPLADTLYQSGNAFYRQADPASAQDQLTRALRVNPNHLRARLLLSQVLHDQGQIEAALREAEEAFRYDEDAARYPLIRLLLASGDEAERAGDTDRALSLYRRVLEISPQEMLARERCAAIWTRQGDRMFAANDLETALAYYQEAGMSDRVAAIAALRKQHEVGRKVAEAETCERREDWDGAAALYQELLDRHPEDPQLQAALRRVQDARELARRYAEALGAYQQGNWSLAVRALADVVHASPGHRDAAELLARAVHRQRAGSGARSGPLRLLDQPQIRLLGALLFLTGVLAVLYRVLISRSG